ncbi:glutaredoxin [Deinococcus sp. HSC-46F16]|uniref:glutaredoxin family protein n=1 Tax=Deinococcus sp. HSC-46F16 TaxID=2910968 RepID=UPI0020A1FC5D|nr:thioredoxin [Deinococcus sp. HSC-46F16]MCP2014695.1 glutaredoxin [Deinococcus sp. HSC-46F16]
MTDQPFVLLTQDHCPQCERLKRMLAGPLRGQFSGQIEIVHRQQHPEEFEHLTREHGLRSTPALIHRPSGQVLPGPTGLGEVQRFLGR